MASSSPPPAEPAGAGAAGRPLPICVLTDYGAADEFVGVLHLVLARLAPTAPVVDLTHEVPKWDVPAGAATLRRLAPWLVPSVVLAVVDPGVATDRRAVALEVATAPGAGGRLLLVGPDNGLLLSVAAEAGGIARAVELDRPNWHLPQPPGAGATFAGRDVFAPVAAHLSLGVDLSEVGSPVEPTDLVELDFPGPVVTADGLSCAVTWIDHFGNAQLNAVAADLEELGPNPWLRLPGGAVQVLARRRSFAEIPVGAVGLVIDSYGRAALCVDRGSAAARLGLAVGDPVLIGPGPGAG